MADGRPHLPAGGPPPLRVWAIVAGILLVSCAFAIPPFLRYRAGVEEAFRTACEERLAGFSKRCATGAAPRVVAIGSSLLHCATCSDGAMELLSRRDGEGELRFLRLASIQSSIDQYLPILDRIAAAPPQILLIESDLLYYRWRQLTVAAELNDYADYCRREIKACLVRAGMERQRGQRNIDPERLLEDGDLDYYAERTNRFLRDYRRSIEERDPRGTLPPGDPILVRLRHLTGLGVHVVLLEMPRTRQADAVVPPLHLKRADALRRQLERECGVQVLRYPGRFPFSMYRDFSHLTNAGAERYSRWLLARVADIAERREVR